MKRIAFVATALICSTTPIVASSAAKTAPRQAVCIPVIVDAGDGPVEGLLCYPQGGRV